MNYLLKLRLLQTKCIGHKTSVSRGGGCGTVNCSSETKVMRLAEHVAHFTEKQQFIYTFRLKPQGKEIV